MPFTNECVPAQLLMSYGGVNIYHTYKNDFIEDVPYTYGFHTWAYGLEGDTREEGAFDVRELPTWVPADDLGNTKGPISELSRAQMEDLAIRVAIKKAIDAEYITRHPEEE